MASLYWRRERADTGLKLRSDARIGSSRLVVTVQDGPLNRRRLNHVLRGMRRSQAGAARFGSKLSLNIDAYD